MIKIHLSYAMLIFLGIGLILGSATQNNYKNYSQLDDERKQKCDNDLAKADLVRKPSNYKARRFLVPSATPVSEQTHWAG
jgi:hypothetical protein